MSLRALKRGVLWDSSRQQATRGTWRVSPVTSLVWTFVFFSWNHDPTQVIHPSVGYKTGSRHQISPSECIQFLHLFSVKQYWTEFYDQTLRHASCHNINTLGPGAKTRVLKPPGGSGSVPYKSCRREVLKISEIRNMHLDMLKNCSQIGLLMKL